MHKKLLIMIADIPEFIRYYRQYKRMNPEKFIPQTTPERNLDNSSNPASRVCDILNSIIPRKKTD